MTQQYWPLDYRDEHTRGDGRESPTAWIITLQGVGMTLDRRLDDDDDAEFPRCLIDGEVIPFISFVDYGRAGMTVDETGEIHLTAPMPDGATHVCLADDPEEVAATPEELDAMAILEAGVEHEVRYYDYPVTFWRFSAATRRFEREE